MPQTEIASTEDRCTCEYWFDCSCGYKERARTQAFAKLREAQAVHKASVEEDGYPLVQSDYDRRPDRLTSGPGPCCKQWTRDQGCPLHGDN